MIKQLSFIFIFFLFLGCQEKKEEKVEPIVLVNTGDKVLDSMATDLLLNRNSDDRKCDCYDSTSENKPNKVFAFTKGLKYSMCGYENTEEDGIPGSFSEFTIYDCKRDAILYEWGATQSCFIKFKNDTIFIEELYPIPNGSNREVNYLPFYTSKLFLKNNELIEEKHFRKDLKKYTSKEIAQVLEAYKVHNEYSKNKNSEEFIKIVNQLFWAYYSGDKKAESILTKLKNIEYGDGAIAEEFEEHIGTFEIYKNRSDR
jgi:hypothetical protein